MADDDSDDEAGSGTPPLEQLASYWAYCRRALSLHKLMAGVVSGGLIALTVLATVLWPRTYESSTVLAAQENRILDGDHTISALTGAADTIRSRENITALVDELQLAKSWESTLTPAGRFKFKVMSWVRGDLSEAVKREALIGMVQSAVGVDGPGWNESKITITVDWQDAKTAAALCDAAEQGFLRTRHMAEISSITEYISILEGHADELRKEIETLAGRDNHEDKKSAAAAAATPSAALPAPPTPVRFAPAPVKSSAPVEDLSELRAMLQEKQRTLQSMEETRRQRVANAEASLAELRTKFTPAHPMVVSAQSALASMAEDSPQMITLRAEVRQLSDDLKAKSAIRELSATRSPGRSGGPAPAGGSNVDALPADIMKLMQEGAGALNPSADADFRMLVSKYATLRDKVTTARVDLDTAEAAFRRRYQIVSPPEVPAKAAKPKVPMMLAIGVLGGLLVGALLAVLAELRTGKIVERWQVDRLGVPRLAAEVTWRPRNEP